MSERKDGDRITVTGYSGGSHFPRTQAATQYRFEADGLSPEGPFHIDGSIYGKDILLRGPGTVLGPVMARGDARIHNHSGQPARLLAGLHVSGSIGSVSRGGALEQSLVASLDNADCVIRGDAIGENVQLENAIVVGNVRGRHVKLTHCIVLGQIIAEEGAVLQASTFASYQCHEIAFEGPCTALFTMGVSERPPVFRAYLDGAGRSWPSDLRFYPVFRSSADGALGNRCWCAASREYEQSALSSADWVGFEATRMEPRLVEGKRVEEAVRVERFAFTVAGRALNFRAIEDQLARLASMLKTSLEFSHYRPNDQQAVRRSWEAELTRDEARVLRLATDLEPLTAETARRVPAAAPVAREVMPPPAPPAAARPSMAPVIAKTPTRPPTAAMPASPPSPPAPPAAATSLRAITQSVPVLSVPPVRATEGATAAAVGPPARACKVVLRDGNVRSGRLGDFDPERGVLRFRGNDVTEKRFEDIAIDAVAAVLIGRAEGTEARPIVGELVRVDLGGGRKLSGHCADPQGRGALWLVPPDRAGSVDAIWVARWAVVGIQPAVS